MHRWGSQSGRSHAVYGGRRWSWDLLFTSPQTSKTIPEFRTRRFQKIAFNSMARFQLLFEKGAFQGLHLVRFISKKVLDLRSKRRWRKTADRCPSRNTYLAFLSAGCDIDMG